MSQYILSHISNVFFSSFHFAEHVWEVDIIRRGLGDSYGIVGPYRVCITDTTLSLVRIGPPTTSAGTNRPDKVDFALAHMRR